MNEFENTTNNGNANGYTVSNPETPVTPVENVMPVTPDNFGQPVTPVAPVENVIPTAAIPPVNTVPPVNNTAPVDPAKPKKKSKLPLIIIIIVILLVLAGGAFAYLYFFTPVFMNPKARVMRAFSQALGEGNVVSELSDNEKYAGNSNILNSNRLILTPDVSSAITAIRGEDYSNPYASEIEITLQKFDDGYDDYSMLYGSGIDIYSETDLSNRQLYSSIGLKYAGAELLNLQLNVDDDVIKATEENFIEDGYISINTESLGKDLANSYFMEMLDLYDVDNISFNIYDLYEEYLMPGEDSEMPDINEYIKDGDEYIPAIIDFYNSIEVESTGQYATYSIGDKDVKCDSFNVTIPASAIDDLSEELIPIFAEYFSDTVEAIYGNIPQLYDLIEDEMNADYIEDDLFDQYEEISEDLSDITFKVYLDNKNRLVGIKAEGETENSYGDEITYEFSIEFVGSDNPSDVINANLYVYNDDLDEEHEINFNYVNTVDGDKITSEANFVATNDDDDVTFSLIKENNIKSGEFSIEFTLEIEDTEEILTFTSEGTVETSDTEVSLTFDDVSLSIEDPYENMELSLSGKIVISELEDDVTSLSGTEYAILNMDEYELMDFVTEAEYTFMDSDLYSLVSEFMYY